MDAPVEFVVTLAPGTSTAPVVAALRDRGFTATAVLGELSMIVGVAAPAAAAAIRTVPGVTAVEPSQTITLPPDGPQ